MKMSSIDLGNFLRTIRENLGYSTYDVNKLCDISPSYLSLIETGKRKPSAIILKKLAPIYNVNYIDLYEKAGYLDLAESEKLLSKADNNITGISQPTSDTALVFVYGSIPAGLPMECIEDIIDTEDIPVDMLKGGKQYFGLRIKGNSMEPDYLDGDTIILEKVDDCESGEDCVVMVNGNEGTFKRVFKNENGIVLQPLNPSYQPMIYSNEQVESLPIKIIGVFVELRRRKRKK